MTYKLLTTIAAAAVFASTAAQATPILSFIIDGNTYSDPFAVTNGSDDGESIIAFGIDLTGAGGICFDPSNGGPCNNSFGVDFDAISGATVSSSTISADLLSLDLTFSSFAAGSTFLFDIDVDFFQAVPAVYGDDMIGATAYADFSDGQRLTGIFSAVVGNDDASAFVATGLTATPAVPLPAGGLLLLSGLGGLAYMRRKNKSA